MAFQPDPAGQQGGSRGGDTAELWPGRGRRDRHRRRRRRRALAAVLAAAGLTGAAVAGFGVAGQLKPRTFTPSQQRRIESWEVASRWRTTPKASLFPASARYRLGGRVFGTARRITLTARRLGIASQASCAKAVVTNPSLRTALGRDGCAAVLRATYADASGSFVLTVGIVVLKDAASAAAIAGELAAGRAGRTPGAQGALSRQLLLRPVHFSGTPAGLFSLPQRQLTWVRAAGSYVVAATVGFADGRPRVKIAGDSYVTLEMSDLASGVTAVVAAPLGAPAPVPHCPGALTAC